MLTAEGLEARSIHLSADGPGEPGQEGAVMDYLRVIGMAMQLWAALQAMLGVKARDAATTAASYQPAAAALMANPKVASWMQRRLSPEEQAQFSEALPLVLFGLDSMTE